MAKEIMTNKQRIEENRILINTLMHSSAKNIDSINMLRYQITSVEPLILFKPQQQYISSNQRKNFIDYTNLKNIGLAYDYILTNKYTPIDSYEIRELHSILAKDTDVPTGFRYTDAKVLGEYAPSAQQIYYHIEQIQYNLTQERVPVLQRAFDLHYDIIMTQPFTDLNKRLARLLMNWFLIQNGYRPIIFNKKTDSTEYMEALHKKLSGNHRAYTEYMEKCMLRTQKEIISLLKTR